MKVIYHKKKKSNKKSNSCHMIHMGLSEKTASHICTWCICTYVTHTYTHMHMQCRVRGSLRLAPITTTQYRIRYNDQHRRLEATSMIETGVIKSLFFFYECDHCKHQYLLTLHILLSCPVWQLMWSTYFFDMSTLSYKWASGTHLSSPGVMLFSHAGCFYL